MAQSRSRRCGGGGIRRTGARTAATALGFEDIAGKWCTTGGSEQFDRDNLIALIASTGERRVFYDPQLRDYQADLIRVTWRNAKGESVHTDFAEFMRRRQWSSLENDVRRTSRRSEFRRC